MVRAFGGAALSLIPWLLACGPSGSRKADAGIDGGGIPDGGPEIPDLTGSWDLKNISQSPGTFGFDGRQVFLASGKRHVAWSEVANQADLGNQDIYTAEEDPEGFAPTPFADTESQLTDPAMVSDGERIYLAWAGRDNADDDYDIHLAIYQAGVWQEPDDLTSEGEGGDARDDLLPSLALAANGDLAIAYRSEGELRLLRVRAGQALEPPTSIPDVSGAGTCFESVAAVAPDGSTHIVSNCNGLYYATDESGSWNSQPLTWSESLAELSPDLRAGASGLHLVFRGDFSACSGSFCGEIFYSHRAYGESFGRAINVSATEEITEVLPVIELDRWNRILVAYTKNGEDSRREAFFAFSEGGQSFSAPINVAPQSPDTDERPGHIALHPQTGLPAIALEVVFRDAQPANIDIFTADYVP